MKIMVVAALVSAAGIASPCSAQSSDASATVDRYLTLDHARQAPGATSADIERVLALMTDSVVYEHPRAGARRQGKAVMRDGMSHYLGTVRNARDSVEQRTVAPGVVVLVTRSISEMLIDNKWQTVNRRAIRVFEFDGALIRRIIEYGW
jgi:hypothetical protein